MLLQVLDLAADRGLGEEELVARLGEGKQPRGSTICAREGSVWITEENNRKDVVLEPGYCFRVERPGLTIVQAFADASVSLA